MTYLGLEGLHVFVTGAAGGIGSAIVQEFLEAGCKVTAHDLRKNDRTASATVLTLQGDISSEESIASSINAAIEHFGPINILCPNAGITDESNAYPIWDMPTELWDKTYAVNVRGTFFTIKHFLKAATLHQQQHDELENLAIVLTGSECGKFGQAGHVEYASGKSAFYGLVMTVKNEMVKMNSKARINAVAPGWVDTKLNEGRLDDPSEMWKEAQATVALAKIAEPEHVARTVAFLASHRAAGHISGQCISVDGGMEGRIIWEQNELTKQMPDRIQSTAVMNQRNPALKVPPIKVLITVDWDAVAGWIGTGKSPENMLADYSAGFFSSQTGVPRLLRLFKRLGISKQVTWFLPGHSIESFPEQAQAIAADCGEIALHGYCHEGAYQLTEEQERDVIEHSIKVVTELSGKKPLGWRAPLYQIRESTIEILQDLGLEYDSSLTNHDSIPYWLPGHRPIPPIKAPEYRPDQKASEWMRPLPRELTHPTKLSNLLEIPTNWYGEDATPLQYYPHLPNSHGYVDAGVMQNMWKRRFEFISLELKEEVEDGGVKEPDVRVYALCLHPDTSGMAHIMPMLEDFLRWLQNKGDQVEFCTMGSVAAECRSRRNKSS